MNYSAYSDPTFSFKEEEIDLLIKSLSFEIALSEGETSAIHLPDFGQDKKKVEALLALRNKLKYENAGCG